MERQSRIIAIVGAPRSGKSHLANELLQNYTLNGYAGLVYNLGRPTDFKAATYTKLYNQNEHERYIEAKFTEGDLKAYKKKPEFFFFQELPDNAPKGKVYTFDKFREVFHGRAAKSPRTDAKLEASFFHKFYELQPKTVLVFDDCKDIFRHGLSSEAITLFSRANHIGIESAYKNLGFGSDIIFILHSLDDVAPQLFRYVNTFINFKYLSKPKFENLENPELEQSLLECFNMLSKAPQYSYTIHLDPQNDPTNFSFYSPL